MFGHRRVKRKSNQGYVLTPQMSNAHCPPAETNLFWWHPINERWYCGRFVNDAFFKSERNAWFIEEGPTWWCDSLPNMVI